MDVRSVALGPAALQEAVEEAARLLRGGGLVAFPTETVYGLGADAGNPDAVRRIFAAKGRPPDNPLIVHVADLDQVAAVAASITPLARQLAQRFWPGPLTLVLEASPAVAREVTGGLDTVAVRMPDHPLALRMLEVARIPVAAPSANRSGRPSPTTAAHVADEVGDRVDLILDGGACRVGLESTVVDARGRAPIIYREGAITGAHLAIDQRTHRRGQPQASPGTRYRHYAPDYRVVVVEPGQLSDVVRDLRARERRVGVVARRGTSPTGAVLLGEFSSSEELAARLYDWLRAGEQAGLEVVVFPAVAESGIGRAVMDRLRRASAP